MSRDLAWLSDLYDLLKNILTRAHLPPKIFLGHDGDALVQLADSNPGCSRLRHNLRLFVDLSHRWLDPARRNLLFASGSAFFLDCNFCGGFISLGGGRLVRGYIFTLL